MPTSSPAAMAGGIELAAFAKGAMSHQVGTVGAVPRSPHSEFRVGPVLGSSLRVLSRHFLQFIALSAVANLPTLLIGDAAAWRSKLVQLAATLWLLVAQQFSQAVVAHATFQDMRGRPVLIGQSLSAALGRSFAVTGTALVATIAFGLGAMLLVIPGLMILTQFYVAVPACVTERLGPLKSLERSAWLTKHHRWKILGIIVLTAIVSGTVEIVIEEIAGRFSPLSLGAVANYAWQTVFNAFDAIVAVVIYHNLRIVKEGIDVDRIAAVFD